MNELTIEQIINMPEEDRVALIFRLAMYSEKKFLGQDVQRIIESNHSDEYLQKSLDKTRPKAW